MLKMVDGTGIIGVDMVCPLGGAVSPPQPPNYDKVEVEGVGNLMLPNSLKAPLERLELIGNSTQGENPAPDNPQEIKSAGKWNKEKQKYEIDVTVNNSGYLQKGSYYERIRPLRLEKGKTYRLYVPNKSEIVNAFILNEEKTFTNGGTLYNYGHGTKKLTVPNKTGVISGECMLQQMLNPGYAFTVTVDGLFLYQGVNNPSYDTDSAYITYDVIKIVNGDEPYTEQALTLTSDRPITKWDKLVEQAGEYGWLYQSEVKEYRGENSVSLYDSGFYFLLNNKNIAKAEGYCSELKQHVPYEKNPCISFNMASNTYAYTLNTQAIYGSSVSEIKEYLKIHPLHLVYKTEATEFVPLSESEQTQLRNLHSYNGTTNITVDSGEVPCGIKLTYRKEI